MSIVHNTFLSHSQAPMMPCFACRLWIFALKPLYKFSIIAFCVCWCVRCECFWYIKYLYSFIHIFSCIERTIRRRRCCLCCCRTGKNDKKDQWIVFRQRTRENIAASSDFVSWEYFVVTFKRLKHYANHPHTHSKTRNISANQQNIGTEKKNKGKQENGYRRRRRRRLSTHISITQLKASDFKERNKWTRHLCDFVW